MADRYARVITGLGGFLDSVGLKVVSMGLIATYGDHLRPPPAARPTRRGPAQPLAPGAGRQRTGQQHPGLRRPAAADRQHARQHQRRRSADCAQAARGVGQLRRRRRDVRGEEPDRVRTWVGRRGAVARARAASNGARCSTSRATCSSSSTCNRCRGAARSTARPAWSTAASRPTSSWRRTRSGAAAWLNFAGPGIKPAQLLHVAIATSETESLDAFRTRCGEVPGFPAPCST